MNRKLLNRYPCLLLILGCLACGESHPTGSIMATAHFLTKTSQVTRVAVSVQPANVNADLTPGAGSTFSGILTVISGSQTVTATAYNGTTVVGTGSATVTVAKGQQAQISITILDNTGPNPIPDHSPVITSFVVPASNAQVGDTLALTATAVDSDGDVLTYAWTVSPIGCGTFSTASAASTNWTAQALGPCTIALTVSTTLNGVTLSDTKSAAVQVAVATGTVNVTVTYVPFPQITNIAFAQGATQFASIARTATDATTRAPFRIGAAYTVTLTFDPTSDASSTIILLDTCNGTIVQPGPFVANSITTTATWTPTVSSGACVITAEFARQGLLDKFPVVVTPGP